MGQDPRSSIAFGIAFEEGFEFPWDTEDGSGDHEEWWLKVCGYVPTKYPYDEKGNYLPGIDRDHPDIEAYYDEKHAFEQAHPFPLDVISISCADYPNYILAVLGTEIYTSWDAPLDFDPASLVVTPEQIEVLVNFCREHNIECEDEPKWLLSAYFG